MSTIADPVWLERNYAVPRNINRRRHSLPRCSWQVHLELDDLFPREMRLGGLKVTRLGRALGHERGGGSETPWHLMASQYN